MLLKIKRLITVSLKSIDNTETFLLRGTFEAVKSNLNLGFKYYQIVRSC